VGELVHRWFEEGANRETIIARAAELGVKLTSGSIQRHKSNHLVPGRDPSSPLTTEEGDPNRRYSELEVIDAVIQRGARQVSLSSAKVTTEQLLSAIALKHKLTEGSVFDALFEALSGEDDEDLSDLEAPSAVAGEAERAEAIIEEPLETPIPGV
jgi:hypothetical protein